MIPADQLENSKRCSPKMECERLVSELQLAMWSAPVRGEVAESKKGLRAASSSQRVDAELTRRDIAGSYKTL
jgi:hypothetical protein